MELTAQCDRRDLWSLIITKSISSSPNSELERSEGTNRKIIKHFLQHIKDH